MFANSASNERPSVSVSTNEPATNMTDSTTAIMDSASRSLRASRLLSVARSIASALLLGARHVQALEPVQHALGGGVAQLVDDPAVGEEDDAIRVRGGVRVVRDHHDGLPEVPDRVAQEPEHLGAGARVEVAGRLVGEDDVRPRDQGAGARDPLLLAAGELGRAVAQPVAEADRVDDGVVPG